MATSQHVVLDLVDSKLCPKMSMSHSGQVRHVPTFLTPSWAPSSQEQSKPQHRSCQRCAGKTNVHTFVGGGKLVATFPTNPAPKRPACRGRHRAHTYKDDCVHNPALKTPKDSDIPVAVPSSPAGSSSEPPPFHLRVQYREWVKRRQALLKETRLLDA